MNASLANFKVKCITYELIISRDISSISCTYFACPLLRNNANATSENSSPHFEGAEAQVET